MNLTYIQNLIYDNCHLCIHRLTNQVKCINCQIILSEMAINQEQINGKIYTTKTPISYDEIQMCFETEEEYVPDLEFEIDPDFDM